MIHFHIMTFIYTIFLLDNTYLCRYNLYRNRRQPLYLIHTCSKFCNPGKQVFKIYAFTKSQNFDIMISVILFSLLFPGSPYIFFSGLVLFPGYPYCECQQASNKKSDCLISFFWLLVRPHNCSLANCSIRLFDDSSSMAHLQCSKKMQIDIQFSAHSVFLE